MIDESESAALKLFASMRPTDHPLNTQQQQTQQQQAPSDDAPSALYPSMRRRVPPGATPPQPAPPLANTVDGLDPAKQRQTAEPEKRVTQQAAEQKTEHEIAIRVYGVDGVYSEVKPFGDDLTDVSPEQRAQANTAARAVFSSIEAPPALARDVTAAMVSGHHRVERGEGLTDEQHAEARTKMHAELRQRFGADGARDRLRDVTAMLQKASALAEWLVNTDADVNLDLFLRLADHARSLRGRGR